MRVQRALPATPKLVKMAAAVVLGFGLGTLLSPTSVAVPGVGPVSGVAVGAAAAVVGAALYWRGPALVGADDCDCGGDCDC